MPLENLDALSTRKGFNEAVRHIKKTLAVMEESGSGANLADLFFEEKDGEFPGAALALRLLLVEKMGYYALSANLRSAVSEPAALAKEFGRWKAVDMIAAYHHPELGLLTANPKNAEQLAALGELRKNELLVIYAGKGGAAADGDCEKAAELALGLFEGRKVKVPPALLQGAFAVKKKSSAGQEAASKPETAAGESAPQREPPCPPAAGAAVPAFAPSGPVRMTPRYAVAVQNELFHNGNVEAWKRIVASYNAKYPGLKVFIYYEGERIHDINSLFKWGKVKHGSAIEFAVAGSEIRDVAKLQRYLAQGASRYFEDFLRGPVNGVLKLF